MKHILNTLAFYASNPGNHSFNPRKRATVGAVKRLEKQGYLFVNWSLNMAAFNGKKSLTN